MLVVDLVCLFLGVARSLRWALARKISGLNTSIVAPTDEFVHFVIGLKTEGQSQESTIAFLKD